MQAYFAVGLLAAASEAVTTGAATQAEAEVDSWRNSDYLFDYRGYLGNYDPYDRSYGFPVYYPSYDHSEEEELAPEPLIQRPYRHTSINLWTSSDSANNFSSESNDWSGPSNSSRSGDSASSSGSDSGKYTYAGDSASDYIDSVSSSSDQGFSFPGDSSFESEDSDYSSTTETSSSEGLSTHHGHFDYDLDGILAAAGVQYAKPGYADYDYVPEVTYVDLDARCARVNFDWNYSGVEGTLDFYQPHHGETLVDADFDNLQRDSRYGMVIHRLAPTGDGCDIKRLGRTLEHGHLGTMITDRKGNGAIHNFRDIDIDDIIGMSVVLQGRYEDFAYRAPIVSNWAQTEA